MPIGKEDKDYSAESKSLVIMSKLPKHIVIIFFTVHFLSVMSNSKSTMLYAFPDLPDLVVRPQGIDIKLLPPYPYPTGGDIIPFQAKIWNIGGAPAYNIQVDFCIEFPPTIVIETVTIPQILPRDTAVVTVYWNTGATHPDFYGEIGDCKFIVIADPGNAITESWEYNNESSITKKVALYPNEPGWPKRVTDFSQPAIANLDGTGSIEIVYPGDDLIYVFNYAGEILVGWPQYFRNVYMIVLADIDNNDLIDVIAVSGDSIKVYDYQGNMLPGWPREIPLDDYKFDGLPAVGYIDDDVSPEIILLAKHVEVRNPVKIFIYTNNGILQDTFNTTYKSRLFLSGASIADVISRGNNEIILSYNCNGSSYTEVFNNNGLVTILDYGSNMVTSALVDLDNDGYAEVITGGSDGKIRAFDAEDNMFLWERQTEGPINCSPAVGDIHPAPQFPGVEITFGNYASEIHLRRGPDGVNIDPWWYTIDPNMYIDVRTSPAIANINGDKYLDIIVGANNRYIYAFKHTMERILPYPLPLFSTPSSPIIGDIDGDRKSEIILASNDGYLHIWENMDSKVLPYSLEWPQFHHDYQRTGVYGWVSGLRGGDANPKTFSTGTTLSFTLEDNLHTKIKIFDAEGHPVKTLVNQTLPQGTYHPVWYGKDNNYAFLPNGIYFIEIKVKNESKIIPVQINR